MPALLEAAGSLARLRARDRPKFCFIAVQINSAERTRGLAPPSVPRLLPRFPLMDGEFGGNFNNLWRESESAHLRHLIGALCLANYMLRRSMHAYVCPSGDTSTTLKYAWRAGVLLMILCPYY